MGVYSRDGGEWVDLIPAVRDASEWTSSSSSLYSYTGSEWVLIYPTASQVGSLIPPESFAVSAGPDHNSVSVSWTNPTQPTIDADRVQIRLAELGAIWADFDLPLTSFSWSALDASTEYTAQIRYVADDAGIPTHYSAQEHVTFTTTAAPIGAPAEDPGGDGIGDSTFPIGTTTSGGGGSTVGGTNACWWLWDLKILSETSYSFSSVDTGTSNGDITEWDYDLATLIAGRVYKVCFTEACDTTGDGVADTFGDEFCGDPFFAPANWASACAGAPDSTAVAGVSFADDLTWRFPKFCKNDDNELVMIEAETSLEVQKGPGFNSFYVASGGEQGATALSTLTAAPFYPTMVAPITALPTTMVKGGDFTIVASFRATTTFSGSDGRISTLASYGGGALSIKLTESATGWTPSATILSTDGVTTLTGSEITFDDGATHRIAVRWDDDGNKELITNAAVVATNTDVTLEIYETAASTAGIVSTPAGLVGMQQLGAARLLTDAELEELTGVIRPRILGGTDTAWSGSDELFVDSVAGEAYVLSGTTLRVIDISDSTAPVQLGSVAGLTGALGRMAKHSDTIYVFSNTTDTLYRVDVSVPATPTLASNLDATNFADVRGCLIVGDTLAAFTTNTLRTWDITSDAGGNPGAFDGSVTLAASTSDIVPDPNDATHVYTICGGADDRIQSVNIATVASPSIADSTAINSAVAANRGTVWGTKLAFTKSGAAAYVDISDPTSLGAVTELSGPATSANFVAAINDDNLMSFQTGSTVAYAHTFLGDTGTIAARLPFASPQRAYMGADNLMYVLTSGHLLVVDFFTSWAGMSDLVLIGRTNSSLEWFDMLTLSDTYVFATSQDDDDLVVADVSDPINITTADIISVANQEFESISMAPSGTDLIVGAVSGKSTVDVSDPTAISQVTNGGTYSGKSFHAALCSDGYYVGVNNDTTERAYIHDASHVLQDSVLAGNPTWGYLEGHTWYMIHSLVMSKYDVSGHTFGTPTDLAVLGGAAACTEDGHAYIYVRDTGGIRVVQKSTMTVVGSITGDTDFAGSFTTPVYVSSLDLMLVALPDGLVVIDVSTPTAPVIDKKVWHYGAGTGTPNCVAYANGYVIVGMNDGDALVYD